MRDMDDALSDHLVRTKDQLLATLRETAVAEGIALPSENMAMRVAEAYRGARDPVAILIDGEPSDDKGIALARAIAMQASQELMTPHYRALRRTRAAAIAAVEALTLLCSGNDELRGRGQIHTPLYDVEPVARLALVQIPEALLRMPAGPSALSSADEEEEAMLMNMTRELSKAFGPSAIGELVDDGGDRTDRRPMDRVRRRLIALQTWSNGNREVAYFPPGWKLPQSG